MTASNRLSEVNPDFDSLVADLQGFLRTKTSNWKDLNESALGETLIELVSAAALFNQYSVEQSFRESFMHTARRDSSIYALARTLGVRVSRKEPAVYSIEIRNKTANIQSVVPYSQFIINGDHYYNEEQLVIPAVGATSSTKTVLKQGIPVKKEFTATGEYFEEILLGEPGFVVANDGISVRSIDKYSGKVEIWRDIRHVANGVAEVLWRDIYTQNKIFTENTTGDGDVSLTFMDTRRSDTLSTSSIHLRKGNTIEVHYIKTKGASIEIDTDSVSVETPFNKNLLVNTIAHTAASGGDEKPSQYYKTFAPYIHRARGRAITKRDFHSIISLYPDVADVQVQGQRETYPNDVNWMNVIRVCVLPVQTDSWGGNSPNPHVNVPAVNPNSRWIAFIDWLKPQIHEAYRVQTYNPSSVLVDIDLNVFMKSHGKRDFVEKNTRENIEKLFEKGIGTLGKNIPLSDILSCALQLEDVDYATLLEPTSDLVLCSGNNTSCKLSFLKLGTLLVNVYYSDRQMLEVYNY